MFPNECRDSVEDIVCVFAEDLLNRVSDRLSISPSLALNFSWPSIGVIDLLSFPLRKKVVPSEIELELLRLTCCYLGVWVSRTWRAAGIEHRIVLDESRGGVCIDLPSAAGALRDTNIIRHPLEQYLGHLFKSMPTELPVLYDFERPYSPETNIVSPVMLGVITGLTGFSEFWWRKGNAPQESAEVQNIIRVLARQTSEWFEHSMPDKIICQVSELYLKGGILPPFLASDSPPLVDDVRDLRAYLTGLDLPQEMIFELIKGFLLCPDEKLSLLGLAMAPAAYKHADAFPPHVIAAARSQRDQIPLMRHVCLFADLEEVTVGEGYLAEPFEKESQRLYEIEQAMGLSPWLVLAPEDFQAAKSFKINGFLEAVRNFEFENAYRSLSEIVEANPSQLGFRLQHIKMEMLIGDFESAHELCKALLSEPGAEQRPDFFYLWGNCLLQLQEAEVAARYFKIGSGLKHASPNLKGELLNNLAWCYIVLGKYKEAKPIFLEAQMLSRNPITVLLNRSFLAKVENDFVLQRDLLKSAVDLCPYDRRVFSNL